MKSHDVRVGVQQDQRIPDEPVLEVLGQLQQPLQHLGRNSGQRHGVGRPEEQIRDAFRARGYAHDDVEATLRPCGRESRYSARHDRVAEGLTHSRPEGSNCETDH